MTEQRVKSETLGSLLAGGLGGMLQQFHHTFGVNAPFSDELRESLVSEELEELAEAWANYAAEAPTEAGASNEAKQALLKEVCDVIYVLVGGVVDEGWSFNRAFAEVHLSNMAKLGPDGKPIRNDAGKAIKPDGWVGPDLSGCV